MDALVGRFVGAFVEFLEGLTTGESTLVGPVVGALVGDLVGALAGPLVGALVGPLVGPLVVPLVDPLVLEVRFRLLCALPNGFQRWFELSKKTKFWETGRILFREYCRNPRGIFPTKFLGEFCG